MDTDTIIVVYEEVVTTVVIDETPTVIQLVTEQGLPGIATQTPNSLASGNDAKVVNYGQYARASGKFSAVGDAQASTYVLRATTYDGTVTQVTTNGTTDLLSVLTILPNQAIAFSGILVAETLSATECTAWEIQGLVRRNSTGIPAIIGIPIVTHIASSTNATTWSVNDINIDTTNTALSITVKGAAATTIRWVLSLQTSEVIF